MTAAQLALNVLSAVLALVAGGLWYRLTTIKAPSHFDDIQVYIRVPHIPYGEPRPIGGVIEALGSGSSKSLSALAEALSRQATLNKWAAGFACGAALTQAAAILLPTIA